MPESLSDVQKALEIYLEQVKDGTERDIKKAEDALMRARLLAKTALNPKESNENAPN